ncbi:cyclic nucleotide-binding domain-containing protein [Candidatus Venteria ishoeyi]|uniref:cAMP receptor protein n=1 Tax=Candidatus Venteria ishoeyi TaxID=1899563 RepID=A0A1H6FA80_9GAMM|nr:cyclic nucleotide-binding domain-containing protein [Candidatus Venteria ishoeyi]MDM8545032.1 cyclic nucleotide-binding domain-containing protein [Candidatus Venteria ishoeyi]SEH07020.1 cAMP receptor protein [Candidatus Venteria ishoeyi]
MIPLEKIIVLNKVPLFSALNTEDIYMISTIASEEAYGDGHTLFYQGDVGDKLFLVVSGEVDILREKDGVETHVVTIGENDFLGELALFDAETRTATARCRGPCTFLVIDRNDMEQLAHEYPAIAFGFIKVLISRMRGMMN